MEMEIEMEMIFYRNGK